jgi:DNA-binding helix-hairpin-helix protein with protein kinase domain
MIFHGQNSEQYVTGRELGKGGEGSVYELQSHRDLVLKKYNEALTPDKIRKLEKMVAMRSPSIEAYAAWPVGLALDDTQTVCGFVMKKLTGYVPLHHVFSPMDRKKMFPDKGYNFLVHVARNVATAFFKLHEAGLVVGDVNEGNILVSGSGISAFIDCDSFQVRDDEKYFFCEVGVPRYTPPELLKKSTFENVIRTTNTDDFSLAVLIFQLLFLGRHPFAGKHKGAADIDEEAAIRQRQFAYSLDNQKRKLSPPPDSLPITSLPADVVTLFHRAFEKDERPTPAEWVKSLDSLLADMTSCSITKLHTYPSQLAECPWCHFRRTRGIMYFLDDSYFQARAVLGNIEEFINGFRPEKIVVKPLNLTAQSSNVVPTPVDKKTMSIYRLQQWTLRSVVSSGIAFIFFYPGVSLICLLLAFFLYKYSPWKKQLEEEYSVRLKRHSSLKSKLFEFTNQYENSNDLAAYSKGMDKLQQLINEFRRLPEELERRSKQMEETLYNEQLDDFLRQFDIESHSIPSIGPAKKTALYNNGFRHAAHLRNLPGTKVPGIGPAFEQVLMNWRRQMSSGFVYIPESYRINIGMQKVNEEIAQLKLQLESRIRLEYQNLNFLKVNIQNRASILETQIKDLAHKTRQAEVDAEAFKRYAA